MVQPRIRYPYAQPSPRFVDYRDIPAELPCQKGGLLSNSQRRVVEAGLVTVITVVRNSVTTLSRTIQSIKAQSYPRVEHLIIDGNSSDGTVDLIRQHEDDVDLWISEPDCGISDAFNKGIALSAGEFVALVNADDWLEPDHISRSVETLIQTGGDFSFGDVAVHDRHGNLLYRVAGDPHYARRLHHAMAAVNHPTVVCRRTVYERNGLFDRSFRIAMDYEWLLRNMADGVIGVYIPNLISHMGVDGMSQRQVRQSLREVRRASVQYGYPPLLAEFRYHARCSRAQIRRALEHWFPKHLTDALRGLLNSSYRGAPPGSSANH